MKANQTIPISVLSPDGTRLAMGRWTGRRGAPTAFLGHSQPTHAGNLVDLAEALNQHGLTVWTGDLRGHGRSCQAGLPRAHLAPATGWNDLIADAAAMAQTAFEGVPWRDRLLVMPNINALLTLEMLKLDPDLARSIVLISPPPNQRALALLAQSFSRSRLLIQSADQPDELTLHHLYSFLGAQIDDRRHLLDVSTADRPTIDALIADPLAHPTPTLGYWISVFKGLGQAWNWPRTARIRKDTRILILYGAEDPMTAMGRFVKPMKAWFAARQITDVTAHRVDGARSAIFLDESRLKISDTILRWQQGGELEPVPVDRPVRMDELSSEVLVRLGSANPTGELRQDELVDLCYNAIDDERRWVEMLYRAARDISLREDMRDDEIAAHFDHLMPHWERSYRVHRQVMTNAALGVVFQDIIARFDLGVALLTAELEPVYYNPCFAETLRRHFPADGPVEAPAQVSALARRLIDGAFRRSIQPGSAETPLLFNQEPLGVYFRPPSLRQVGLMRDRPSGVLVLRSPQPPGAEAQDQRGPLLQLAYGLTAQEAVIALRILSGAPPEGICDELGITINTIRTHLKRIYEKVGVSGQNALTARLLAGPIGWLANRV